MTNRYPLCTTLPVLLLNHMKAGASFWCFNGPLCYTNKVFIFVLFICHFIPFFFFPKMPKFESKTLTFNRSDPVVFSAKCGTGIYRYKIIIIIIICYGMGWGEMLSYDILLCLLFLFYFLVQTRCSNK